MTAFFLAWYFLYVLLSIFAPGFMNTHVFGRVSVGLIFGFLQFVTTFAITFIYARWANKTFDPAADAAAARPRARSSGDGHDRLLTGSAALPAATAVGSPALNIGIFSSPSSRDAGHRHQGGLRQEECRGVLHPPRARLLRPSERHRHRR